MSNREYASLTYAEKRELLRSKGNFVSERINSTTGRTTVFTLFGFYVEMNFDLRDQVRYIRVLGNYYEVDDSCRNILINLN